MITKTKCRFCRKEFPIEKNKWRGYYRLCTLCRMKSTNSKNKMHKYNVEHANDPELRLP